MDGPQQEQAKFDGWAVVEVFGHQQHIGYVTTQAFGQAVLFRVDTPALPDREYELERPQWTGAGQQPAGAKVKRPGTQARSVLLGAGSIYRITPCTESAAQLAIDRTTPRDLIAVDIPANGKVITAAQAAAEQDPDDYDPNDDMQP